MLDTIAKSLASHDVVQLNDTRHLLKDFYEKDFDVDYFANQSKLILKEVRTHLLGDIVANLDKMKGVWNPGSFMVFSLGAHKKLGALRLHVWPEGIERVTEFGPNIHDHSWYISSHILAGDYEDTLFDLDDAANGPYEVHITSRGKDNTDQLIPTGKRVSARKTLSRLIRAGDTHFIEAGQFHLTEIPTERHGSTLLFTSPAIMSETRVLLKSKGDGPSPVVSRVRSDVSQEEKLLAQKQLREHLSF